MNALTHLRASLVNALDDAEADYREQPSAGAAKVIVAVRIALATADLEAEARARASSLKVIYLAHPLGAGPDRARNRRAAANWLAWATLAHRVAVVADWITLSGELDETPANRELGLEVDLALVARVDELWLVGGRVSPGMQLEADEARRLGKPVVDLTSLGPIPPAVAAR